MGDVAIADALKVGVREIINTLGEELTFVKKGTTRRDPRNPSRRIVSPSTEFRVEGTISAISDDLIDEVLIMSGDKEVTIEANGNMGAPVVSDEVVDSSNRRYSIVRVHTNRISGINVSYRVILR